MTIAIPQIRKPAINLGNVSLVLAESGDCRDGIHHKKTRGNGGKRGYRRGGYRNTKSDATVALADRHWKNQPSESHLKSEFWVPIITKAFGKDPSIHRSWEYHLVPGNAGKGSAKSDFAAITLAENGSHIVFFIADLEQGGFEIYTEYAVIACEAAFELNCILEMANHLTPDEVTTIKVHVALINGTSISLGVIRPMYNAEKTAILYVYGKNICCQPAMRSLISDVNSLSLVTTVHQ
ncbi:hypothetical protein BC938DRAFT_476326 [Jimgerdemannia flammicorona]|uniref:Uncharacterized protein n=1 Tax=Jimgerdemannia flammicorona TaxID=994334 RepID=A0A433QQM6_9FUNG|nr:hypothetical protein BC938DRAFT_476326 [Jimgerdemannia flammicorona]